MDFLQELINAPVIEIDPTPVKEEIVTDVGWDAFRNTALIDRDGMDGKIWRWKPATIKDWLLGKDYLDLSETIRPVVFKDVCDFFECDNPANPFQRRYDEAIFCEGIGSGKSFKTSIITTYYIHLLLCLDCPQKFFGIDKSSKIAIMNMSVSEQNAIKVIFSEISTKIDNCKWFQDRPWGRDDAREPDPECRSELRFKNNIFVIPGSSSWRTAVGYNIIVGIMDEAASYRNTNNVDQAEDIFHSLQRRLGSRFEGKGAIIVAGSPLYENDFLETRLKQATTSSRILARRRSIWAAKYNNWNGEVFYMDKVNRMMYEEKPSDMTNIDIIPKVDFLYKAFKANPTKAYRDFGAVPSRTINSFFEQPSIVVKMINKDRREDPVNADGSFKAWFKPKDRNAFHTVHIDLGLVKDAAGLCMSHYCGTDENDAVKVYVDLIMRFQGNHEKPVQIDKLLEYIYTLSKLGFNIQFVTMDGFNSAQALQVLEKKGYSVEVLSVDRNQEAYQAVKEAIREGRLNYYCISPAEDVTMRINTSNDDLSASEVLMKELMSLEDIQGKKVDHPPSGSKDCADALAGTVYNIIKRLDYFGTVTIN